MILPVGVPGLVDESEAVRAIALEQTHDGRLFARVVLPHENSADEEFKQRVRDHIARFQQRADEAGRAVEIFQANMRVGG